MSNPLADFTTGDLVSYYAEYRRQIDAITAEADAKLAKPKKMLAALTPGDVVMATVTDRVARDPPDQLHRIDGGGQASAAPSR